MLDSAARLLPNAALSDSALRRRSFALGITARTSRRRFLATLPEIAKRGLARKAGGILAYAAKRGGAGASEVREVLALAERLAPFAKVWALYESGAVGASVIRRVPVEFLEENQEAWAEILRKHSRREVDALVQAERDRRAPSPSPSPSPPNPNSRPGVTPEGASGSFHLAGHAGRALPERISPSPKGAEERLVKGAARRGERDRKGASSGSRRVVVELTEDELARLRVVCQERTRAAGRTVSQGEALRLLPVAETLPGTPQDLGFRSARERARAGAEVQAREGGRAA